MTRINSSGSPADDLFKAELKVAAMSVSDRTESCSMSNSSSDDQLDTTMNSGIGKQDEKIMEEEPEESDSSGNDEDNTSEGSNMNDQEVEDEVFVPMSAAPITEEQEKAFLEECERLGINRDLAMTAAQQSRDDQNKWWSELQAKKLGSSNELQALNFQNTEKKNETKNTCKLSEAPNRSHASVMQLVKVAKQAALKALKHSQGDTTDPKFQTALDALAAIYQGNGFSLSSHKSQVQFEGNWVNLSRPHFPNCLGTNDKGHFMYTLGRMSFDMFRPSNLRCSIQKVLCKTRPLDADAGEVAPRDVPRSLRQQIEELESQNNTSLIKTYE